jgi:uncharacterized protein (TIGR03437 family)
VGLIRSVLIAASATCMLGSSILSAAPRLRLVKSTIGPLSIAQAANGATQTVEAYNAGDSSLNLTLSSSVTWIATSVGAQRACSSQPGICTPLQFSLNTATLSAGTVTGIVTVTDPNAVDAPQTVTVTVQIGGAVPGSLNVYVAPGGTRDIAFVTNSSITGVSKTNDGGQWLSLALDANGSFLFTYPYRIHIAPSAGMNPGTYNGTLTTGGSSFAQDNKSIAVTMQVTTQPIAQASISQVNVRLAQGQPPASVTVPLSNLGQGTLTVTGATITGASWLTSTVYSSGAVLTLDPGSLSPGTYTSSVAIVSNAANGAVTVPISFQVEAQGSPSISYQGVVDNAIFGAGDTVARGDILVVLGDQLSLSPLTLGSAPPLSTAIGGAKILVNGSAVPMYYSSYGQLAFQMPYEISNGVALVQVQRDSLSSNTVSVNVADRAPRLLLIGSTGYGAIQNQDFSIPMPTGALPGYQFGTHPANVGDALTIYAIGLGPTSPAVASGVAAPGTPPFAPITTSATVNFGGGIGGTLAAPLYAGLAPGNAGLYQVNVVIPQNVPKGVVNLTLTLSDSVSNSVQIYVQ